MTDALVVEDLRVAFGGLRALDGVTIRVGAGEIVGLIGPNGAGKTTLFDGVCGFVSCEGSITLAGRDIGASSPHVRAAAGLGRSFQDARLFGALSVLETLQVAAELHLERSGVLSTMAGLRRARRAERRAEATASELIDLMGLAPYRAKFVRELSTGTRRIVDLACVLAQSPSVVLLDEPSSGIAQRETESLGTLLLGVREHLSCSMVLIEHDMPLLLSLAERVYALETGRVIAEGRPDDVVHDPEVIRSYLGADASAIQRSGRRT